MIIPEVTPRNAHLTIHQLRQKHAEHMQRLKIESLRIELERDFYINSNGNHISHQCLCISLV